LKRPPRRGCRDARRRAFGIQQKPERNGRSPG
jgi:hypothetical protein